VRVTDAAIQVDGLRVVRGGREVLKSITLEIPAGRITGLLGPSGCGKTTLMRAIVGVQVIAGGSVTVLGAKAGSSGLRTRVGYVTQAPSVYEDLTIEANLRYFRALYGAPRERTDQTIRTVGLEDERKKLVRNLSGGQRTRVSLASALLADPQVLILDEPTVGLDPVLREDLWQTFRKLANAGTTLLVSSHVMDEAERCDDLLLMREGEILAQQPPAQLLAETGTASIEAAFLKLVRGREVAR
jgi:ABC-2 type transport system ATP-binding protein